VTTRSPPASRKFRTGIRGCSGSLCYRISFSQNRFPPIGSTPEGKLFRIMLWQVITCLERTSGTRRDISCYAVAVRQQRDMIPDRDSRRRPADDDRWPQEQSQERKLSSSGSPLSDERVLHDSRHRPKSTAPRGCVVPVVRGEPIRKATVNERAKEEAETTNRIQDDADNDRASPFPNGLPADRLIFITARFRHRPVMRAPQALPPLDLEVPSCVTAVLKSTTEQSDTGNWRAPLPTRPRLKVSTASSRASTRKSLASIRSQNSRVPVLLPQTASE
jgi:hypothetical protein